MACVGIVSAYNQYMVGLREYWLYLLLSWKLGGSVFSFLLFLLPLDSILLLTTQQQQCSPDCKALSGQQGSGNGK